MNLDKFYHVITPDRAESLVRASPNLVAYRPSLSPLISSTSWGLISTLRNDRVGF